MQLYISNSNDVYFNISFESWLFDNFQDQVILFLWSNNPSVVIGRGQNPWLECNLPALKNDNVNIVRRQSGGGTVYHDLENLNYTIISSKQNFDKNKNLEIICSNLKEIGVETIISPKKDITVEFEEEIYKISGSAFREKKDRAMHHGTLLVDSNVEKLYNYLHHKQDKSISAKGVTSNRSKVINLKSICPNISVDKIIDSFKNKVLNHIYIDKNSHPADTNFLIESENILKSWEWTFGKTIPFQKKIIVNNNKITLNIVKGLIIEVTCKNKLYDLKNLNYYLKNCKHRYLHKIENLTIFNTFENELIGKYNENI